MARNSFHLPVCMSDHNKFEDYEKKKDWNFPMHCGGHRASETAGFMKELNIGLGSDAYKWHTVVRKNHNQLWRDRLSRVGSPIYSCSTLFPFSSILIFLGR